MSGTSIGLLHRINRFARDRRGATALTFALLTPMLLLGMAVTSDAVNWYLVKQRLQRAADTSALAAARELTLSNRDDSAVIAAARRYAVAHLASGNTTAADVQAELVANRTGVKVQVAKTVEPVLGRLFPDNAATIRVMATARASGASNVCLISLAPTTSQAISFRDSSRLSATGCAIYSNSTAADGLSVRSGATITSSLVCSAGGSKIDASAAVTPTPTSDCPKLGDPLAGRAEPPVGACTAVDMNLKAGSHSLMPGVYCGGLRVAKTANVTLSPGVYVFKDGNLQVTDTATLKGQNVGLYFTNAGMHFDKQSVIDLTAPRDGALAGILLFESATNAPNSFRITSDNARVLLGTIYLPKSRLLIDGTRPLADQSAYTVIVASELRLESGPDLVLNTNYGLTDIPVPAGVGPVGRVIKLGE